jgi:hypothetical protein
VRFFERDEEEAVKAALAARGKTERKINRQVPGRETASGLPIEKRAKKNQKQSRVRYHLHPEADASRAKGGYKIVQGRRLRPIPPG